jgi:hypothetical protein
MEWVYLLAMTQEGASVGCDFLSGETLVWMFCGLGNVVTNYVVISWPCIKEVYMGQNGDSLVTLLAMKSPTCGQSCATSAECKLP